MSVNAYSIGRQEVGEPGHTELIYELMQELDFDARQTAGGLGSNLPSGVCFHRIVAQYEETGRVQFTSAKKMLLLK